ncbi:MAG: sigma factor [Flavobacteriaceae bacterium]|nr:sigma factor [Flavobacteriaceae bacterium]
MNYKKLHISPLIRACKKKDQIAQMELYQRYHLLLYQAAYGILKNRDDAQDAMQEGMISAFEKLDQYRGDGNFGAPTELRNDPTRGEYFHPCCL